MTIKSYSKQDTSIIKGFAILCICLHNFLHWIPPYTGENEFYFSSNCINNFFEKIASQPSELVNILFTYLGHYGVQIFIFISGFGLTLSMLKHHKTWLHFIVDRLKKLYPLLITAILFYILFTIFIYSKFPSEMQFKELGYKLLFIHTLLPYQGLSINGPWWFFGLIFQFYLVFPILFYLIKKYNVKAFLIICLCSYAWSFASLYYLPNVFEVYYFQNFPAHLPEFCFGILLALNKDKKLNNIFFFIALALFCLGNYYQIFFPFTFLAITIISVFTYQCLKNIQINKTLLRKFLIFFGNISMTLFAVHGFLRNPFVKLSDTILNTPLGHLTTAILFLIAAVIISLAANHVYNFFVALFDKIKLPEKHNKTFLIISRTLQVALIILSSYILIYFINQNNFDNVKKYSDYESVENISISSTKEYSDITKVHIDKRSKKLKIEGYLDIKKDTDSKLPPLVLDIEGILWKELKLTETNVTSDFNTYSFDYEYACPFINNLKNKDIKLYFWNKDKTNFEYRNVSFSISTN